MENFSGAIRVIRGQVFIMSGISRAVPREMNGILY